MASWEELAGFLVGLPTEERDRLSSHAGLGLPEGSEGLLSALQIFAAQNPRVSPSALLATAGARAGSAGDLDLARRVGVAALELADTSQERQLAHVSLARTHFQNRREAEDLAGFEEHCRAAIEAGHAGTFCYERLAALHEYRGEVGEAAALCRRAIEVLVAAGDPRSADGFRRRLDRLSRKGAG